MKTVKLLIKYGVLVAVMFILWIICISGATAFIGYREPTMSGDAATRTLVTMLGVCAVNTAVLMFTILRSRWRGLKLVAVIALQIFGVQFFISQIETLYFNYGVKMPEDLIIAIVIGGFVMAWAFSFVAAAVLGKLTKLEAVSDAEVHSASTKEFALKFVLLAALVYPTIYILAGYFIAWQFEDVRVMYTGSAAKASFGEQFSLAYLQSWLYPYQVFRGALWTLIALPVIRMTKGGLCETSLVVAMLFACLMNLQLLLPNPFMQGDVALAHFLETFSSNVVWGVIVAGVMYRHYEPRAGYAAA